MAGGENPEKKDGDSDSWTEANRSSSPSNFNTSEKVSLQ